MNPCTDPAAIAEWWSGFTAALFFGGVGVALVVVAIAWAIVAIRRGHLT